MQLKEDGNGNVKIVSSNAGKEFAAEEISAQVLRKLVDDAGKFLNDKVAPQHTSSCVQTVAALFFALGYISRCLCHSRACCLATNLEQPMVYLGVE